MSSTLYWTEPHWREHCLVHAVEDTLIPIDLHETLRAWNRQWSSPGTHTTSPGRSLQLVDAILLLECTVTPLKELGTEIAHLFHQHSKWPLGEAYTRSWLLLALQKLQHILLLNEVALPKLVDSGSLTKRFVVRLRNPVNQSAPPFSFSVQEEGTGMWNRLAHW